MSNIQPDSVISCLDCPDHVQAVLDASMWAAKRLHAPIGLLHAAPNSHRKAAIDYSGCLTGDDDSHMLNRFTSEEKNSNGKLRDYGRHLIKQSDEYCQERQGRYQHQIYALHRQDTIAHSLDYVDDVAELIVIGNHLTCSDTLPQLIRESKCPILVTPERFNIPKTALFAFDDRPICHELLDWLCSNELVRQLTVHVVMIGAENERNKDALRGAYARLKQAGIQSKKSLINSRDVASALLYYQQHQQLDMLITGAFGESRLHELLHGSDTRKLLGASKTPYLLYPKT